MVHFHIISKLVKVSSEALLKYHLYEFELASALTLCVIQHL